MTHEQHALFDAAVAMIDIKPETATEAVQIAQEILAKVKELTQ